MPSSNTPIDRRAVVARHAVRLASLDPASPLSVGNGEFAFTADVTGLQTFPEAYDADPNHVPLCTQSQWGWHTTPPGPGVSPEAIRYTDVDTFGLPVPYLISGKGQEATFNWLRENPHRLHLGQIGFVFQATGAANAATTLGATGQTATVSGRAAGDISAVEQTLDMWTGLLTSRFRVDGEDVHVETCCPGEADAVAVRVKSPLLKGGRLGVQFAFPYGSQSVKAVDWEQADAHTSTLRSAGENRVEITRQLDDDVYHVTLAWSAGTLKETAKHHFKLTADAGSDALEFVCVFSPTTASVKQPPLDFAAAKAASAAFWESYWTSGAAIDLVGSTDPRAHELERRIVTSQYLMRVNCAGSLPPAETGVTCNSWFGKFHLEMHWWHGVHFALWNRLPLLEKSLGYYHRILPEARKIAQKQGYAGVRWPKMVDGRGVDAPSPVGPLLLWQQPHPIYYAELVYREKPTAATLAEWQEIVDQTAEFMVSFLKRDDATGRYVIGPPLKAVQENNDTMTTWNPTYELTYWRQALEVAQAWRQRLGQSRHPKWDDVLKHLAPLPQKDGRYLYQDGLDDTYTTWSWEHPAVMGAMGMLNGDGVDADVMRRSVEKTMEVWQWDRTWGWDFPMTAMAAARTGLPELAIDAFFIKSIKNTFAASGHVYQRPSLPLYLPANGGLLAAVALMAGGWDGAPDRPAPGFPQTGWAVKAEGFRPIP